MATDWDRFVSDDLPAITAHFDAQLTAIRSLVEAASAERKADHHSLVAEVARVARDVADVRADVKAQNGRVAKAETEIAYMKGQRSGGSATYNALMVGIGTLIGVLGAALALTQMGG